MSGSRTELARILISTCPESRLTSSFLPLASKGELCLITNNTTGNGESIVIATTTANDSSSLYKEFVTTQHTGSVVTSGSHTLVGDFQISGGNIKQPYLYVSDSGELPQNYAYYILSGSSAISASFVGNDGTEIRIINKTPVVCSVSCSSFNESLPPDETFKILTTNVESIII